MTWGATTAWERILPGARELSVLDWRRGAAGFRTVGGTRSPGVAQQPLLPGEPRAHDGIEIVEARLPAKLPADALGAGYERRRISGAARLLAHLEGLARHPLDAGENLPHAVTMSVADVQRGRAAPRAQVLEGGEVRGRQILDVNVVAVARAIGRRIVGAEDRDLGSLADRRLAGYLDEQRRIRGRLADAAAGIRARHVEVAQRYVAKRRGFGHGREHPLRHELGRAVGIDGRGRGVLGGRARGRDAVDRRGGGKHEVPHLALEAALKERSGRAGVVAVVLERIAHRLRHDGAGGEMHHRVDAMRVERGAHGVAVADVADHERHIEHRLPEPAREIVENHQFTAELAAAELAVAAPLAIGGETLLRYREFRFAAFPWMRGRSPELDAPEARQILGRSVARLHQIGAVRPFAARPRIGIERLGWEARSQVLASELLPDALRERYVTVSGALLERVSEAFTAAAGVREIRLHGDCHLGNLLWNEHGPVFVDLDDCASGVRAQDLWMMLAGSPAEQQRQWGELLEGYRQFADFDFAEVRLIEPLRALRMLHHAAWVAHRWSDPAFPRAFPWAAEPRYREG